MITVNIRKQGGAAVMTIPANVLKMLDIEAGGKLELNVIPGAFTARPASKHLRKRYSLNELLRGVTPEQMERLNKQIEWSREGESIGGECL